MNFQQKMKSIESMSDIELLDFYIENSTPFIDPRIFRHVVDRGLYYIVDGIPSNDKAEIRSVVMARLSKSGEYVGDPEIEAVASIISRIKDTQRDLCSADPADALKIKELAGRLASLADRVLDFYK